MRPFKLCDALGKYVRCIAHGRHAENELLTAGAFLILSFASASRDRQTNSVCFWLFDETHVAVEYTDSEMPTSRTDLA